MNHHSIAYGNILGVVAAIPSNVVTNSDCPDPQAAEDAAKLTGVRERRWVRGNQTALDLNLAAARRLLEGLAWTADSLDLIVYVSQTPSRAVPADVYSVAAALGASCPCMHINWSCSGYVYGLWTAMRMASTGGARVLLLVGDATSTIADPSDRATAPLFGDAGSATAIQAGGREPQHFVMGTDGIGVERLCTDWDLAREAPTLHMDGSAVFNFTLKTVPKLALDVAAFGNPDAWLLHQANAFMLKNLVRKCAIDPAKAPINIDRFGNTSCASIPLLMADVLADRLTKDGAQLAMLGFGAGWAWAGGFIRTEPLQVCELIEA